MKTNPRGAALFGLLKVEKDIFISEALNLALTQYNLSAKDQKLMTELLYGTVRMQGTLDYYLNQISSRKLDTLDSTMRNVLRLGAYQLMFLDRVPASAAVNESVKLAPAKNRKTLAGFINGVLRNLARRQESIEFPDLHHHPVDHIAARYSHPQWLVRRWISRWGVQETIKLCQANNAPPLMSIRVNTLKVSVADLKAHYEALGLTVQLGQFAPDVLVIEQGLRITEDPKFQAGFYYVQNESSVLVGHALSPKPGECIYDLCSAPGGKSTHIAGLMKNQGDVLAIDQSDEKIRLIKENAARLGITIIRPLVADASCLPNLAPADRVVVDAPCSGLGVLRHKPDIRWRKKPQEILTLVSIQRSILTQAADLVRPGGTLVYSTCSTEREENEDNILWFLDNFPEFQIQALPNWFPNGTQTMLQILPHQQRIDGFFICRLVRNGKKQDFSN